MHQPEATESAITLSKSEAENLLYRGSIEPDLKKLERAVNANVYIDCVLENSLDWWSTGYRAVHWATYYRHLDALSFLAKSKANMNIKNGGGWAPIHTCLGNHFSTPMEGIKVIERLLILGANPNEQSTVASSTVCAFNARPGETGLHTVMQAWQEGTQTQEDTPTEDVIILLWFFGASLDIHDINGNSPFKIACHMRKLRLANFIYSLNALETLLDDDVKKASLILQNQRRFITLQQGNLPYTGLMLIGEAIISLCQKEYSSASTKFTESKSSSSSKRIASYADFGICLIKAIQENSLDKYKSIESDDLLLLELEGFCLYKLGFYKIAEMSYNKMLTKNKNHARAIEKLDQIKNNKINGQLSQDITPKVQTRLIEQHISLIALVKYLENQEGKNKELIANLNQQVQALKTQLSSLPTADNIDKSNLIEQLKQQKEIVNSLQAKLREQEQLMQEMKNSRSKDEKQKSPASSPANFKPAKK